MDQVKQVQKYYESTYLFQHPSKVLSVDKATVQDKNKQDTPVLRILLQQNIFHPQGGGQPDDDGSIGIDNIYTKYLSLSNDKVNNQVYLDLPYSEELQQRLTQIKDNNGEVIQQVDEAKRRLYARIHSAGHFLDMALRKAGIPWLPGKGFHFPEGSYVEYIGKLEGDADAIAKQIQTACDEIMNQTQEQDRSRIEFCNSEQLLVKMGELPEYLKQAENIRYVQLCQEDKGCPCGGTHVEQLSEIGKVQVVKVQKKGKNIRVSYKVI